MPGSNPSRPAPAHILNKFVYSLLGKGTAFKSFQEAIFKSGNQLDSLLAKQPRGEVKEDLRVSALAVFNSDRRGFPSLASYLPAHAGIVSSDPSDDGFGSGLISLLSVEQRHSLRSKLVSLLNPPIDVGDPVTRFAASFAVQLSEGEPVSESDIDSIHDPMAKPTILGTVLFELISRRIDQVLTAEHGADRIRFLLRLSNFLSAYVCLSLLFEGAHRNLLGATGGDNIDALDSDGIGSVLGIPVYCGKPPGPPSEMAVELSHRCLRDAVRRTHEGIRNSFVNVLPTSEDELERLVTSRLGGAEAQKVLSALRQVKATESPRAAFGKLLTPDQLHQSVKNLGTKVGLVAPRKGFGKSRLVLETTFIDSLAYFVGEDEMRFESFVDQCYLKLGLLIGLPESITERVLQRLLDISGQSIDLIPVLQASQEQCRQRLIHCGLAQEFSDHATILRLT
jgi:hypothetical protein